MAQVKAAFVLNIIRFATWPESVLPAEATQLRLCMLKDDLLAEVFEGIRGKGVGSRKLEIQGVEGAEAECHALFIPESRMAWFDQQGGPGIREGLLVIGDHTDGGSRPGGHPGEVITLIRDGNRIAFEIDLDAAKAVRIELSSELLKLGRIMRHDR